MASIPKDPSTVMTPFQFDRNIKSRSRAHRCRRERAGRVVGKLRELGANPTTIGARPSLQGGGLGVESPAAFDSYVEWKAKELGIDLATIPEPPQRGGGGGGGGGRPVAAQARTARGAAAAGAAISVAAAAGRPGQSHGHGRPHALD